MISPEFIAQCILQHTEQGAVEWFVDNENGGYFTVIDGWSIRFKSDGRYSNLIYQKGPKLERIIVTPPGFFNSDETEMRRTMRLLIIEVRKRVFPNDDQETVKVLEEQEQKVRKEFCASMLGWNK